MINNIKMAGIKGQNSTQELSGRDIIVGRNGAGKTTRLQAMSLAILGYVPGKGKTAADTFELASDDTMSVGIEATDFEIEREFKKSSKLSADGTVDAKISQSITISPSAGERTIKDKEQRIKEAVGDCPAMLDFASFLSLTDIKQRDFIYGLSGEYSWNRDRVFAKLKEAVLRDELEENNPDMYQIMLDNYDDTIKQYRADADVQSGLLAMTEHAKNKLSHWKKEKQSADAAARKLTELKNNIGDTDRLLNENIEKLTAMEKEREDLVKEEATCSGKNQLRKERELELEKINAEINALKSTDDGAEVEKLTAEIQELTELIEKQKKSMTFLSDKSEKLETEIQELTSRLDTAKEHYYSLSDEIKECKAIIKADSAIIERIQDNAGVCAFSADIPCTHNFSPFIADMQNRIDECYATLDTLEENFYKASDTAKSLDSELNQKRELKRENHLDTRHIQVVIADNEKGLELLKRKLADMGNSSITLTSKQEQTAQIEAWLNENPGIDLTDHREQIVALKQKIDDLKIKIDEQKKVRNDIVNIKANIIDAKTASYEQECWQQIVTAIGQKGIQGNIVKEMLDPLREEIDSKLEEMNLPYRFYFKTENDRGKEVFEFGGLIDGERRPFGALSQGEQLMMLIALMTTIIEKSNPPVKILAIDNCNHLDVGNFKKVIKGLNTVGKAMDNIILAGTLPADGEDGWTVWNLE